MKKQNRNAFAYARQSQGHQSVDNFQANTNLNSNGKPTIYSELIGQMDPSAVRYISKIVNKTQKEQKKLQATQKSLSHERTKSYANILVDTPCNSKKGMEKGLSHRGSHPSTQINNIFFSLNNSPKREEQQVHKERKSMQKEMDGSSFMQILDGYITDLSLKKENVNLKRKIEHSEQNMVIVKNTQKTRESSVHNLKMIQKMQTSFIRQKQLKIANEILLNQNHQLKQKLKNKTKLMKTNMKELIEYGRVLNNQLKQQRRERKKMEQLFLQIQNHITSHRPQRKTLVDRPRIEQFLLSESTEQQDDQMLQNQLYRTLKRKQQLLRTTAKNSRISGVNFEQLNAMLAMKSSDLDMEDNDSSEDYEG